MDLVTPGVGLLFWMLLSFTVVLLILKKYAWKPILKSLKDREDSIEGALTAADEAKKEMARLKADNEKIMAEARKERDSLLKEARELKDKIIADAKEQATKDSNKIIQDAAEQIDVLKTQAMTEMKNQVAELSIEIAEKIIRKDLSGDNKQKEYLETLIKEMKFN